MGSDPEWVAQGRCDLHWCAIDDGPVGAAGEQVNMAQYGVYYDSFSKSTVRWQFTHRRFVQCYIEHGAWQGEVPNPRSSVH